MALYTNIGHLDMLPSGLSGLTAMRLMEFIGLMVLFPHYSVRIQPDTSSFLCGGSVEAFTESTSTLSVAFLVPRSAPLLVYRTSLPWPMERPLK